MEQTGNNKINSPVKISFKSNGELPAKYTQAIKTSRVVTAITLKTIGPFGLKKKIERKQPNKEGKAVSPSTH